MRLTALSLTLACLAVLPAGIALPAETAERAVPLDARRALALTVYQNDMALVEETRWTPLIPGENRLAIEGIGEGMMPESLTVGAGTAGLKLLEQAFQPADLTAHRLLQRAVGKRVRLIRTNPETGEETSETAILLSMAEGPILQVGDRVEIAPPGRIVLDEVPADLHPRPVVRLTLDSTDGGPAELALTYLTQGLGWQADYVARFDEAAGRLALTGRVTLNNQGDTGYENAALRLVAGEVTRADGGGPRPYMKALSAAPMAEAALDRAGGAPQAAAARYLYDTGRTISLGAHERKQVTLFETRDIPAQRRYRFEGLAGAGGPQETDAVAARLLLTFENPAKADGAEARPMPAGTLRVYEASGDSAPLYAGAATIDHTPAGEKVEVALGEAFDVTARSRMTGYERLSDRSFESAQEIVVSNAGDKPVSVEIAGSLPRGWTMQEESAPHSLPSANRPLWTLDVPAGGSATLTYRVRVTN